MTKKEFFKQIVKDKKDLLQEFIGLLKKKKIPFCIIGGLAVNAYAEPVVSLDLDLVVAVEQTTDVERWLAGEFKVERFPHSLNVSAPGSDLRVQIQTDPRYAGFVGRATERTVLGRRLPVAALEDVMSGKIWAVEDPARRPSKRQKDLADISRLLEAYPETGSLVPGAVRDRLVR